MPDYKNRDIIRVCFQGILFLFWSVRSITSFLYIDKGRKCSVIIDNMGYIPYNVEEKVEIFNVDYYVKEDGECPVEKFLDSLDTKMRAKCFWLISLLEKNGNELREPYSKYLRDGLYELRIKQSTNVTRIIYFFMVENKIILTNGFVKKTMKTPRKELELAMRYREDYLSEKEGKNE